MFRKIELSDSNNKEYEILHSEGKKKNMLDNLSQINVFIGANNSGKSRMLRDLFGRSDYRFEPNVESILGFSSDLAIAIEKLETMSFPSDFNTNHLIKRLSDLDDVILFNISDKKSAIDFGSINTLFTSQYSQTRAYYRNRGIAMPAELELIRAIPHTYFGHYEKAITELSDKKLSFDRYYIPTLRSLKDLSKGGTKDGIKYHDIFNDVTLRHYFQTDDYTRAKYGSINPYSIFTGLTFYDDIKELSGSRRTSRRRKDNFQKFLSQSFFNNKEVEITSGNDGKVLIRIDEEEREIEHLGDGIQSVIVLTYRLFMHQGENAVFFFEEPETHLHPGFQRLFIETLRRPEFHTFQYFISTHSNHFLDITLEHDDMSVYTFKKEIKGDNVKFLIENVAHGDDNILQLIGANKSSVFLSNCTIWVEGITDRIYLRRYLDLYQESIKDTKSAKVFKEDYHYSFLEYGGGNITHWSFLDSDDEAHQNINIDRLCAKAFVVTDSDNARAGSKKKQRQELLKEKLGDDRYYCLEAKEIENLLTKKVIEKVVLSYEKEDTVIDFAELKQEDIPVKGLGKLIESTVTGMANKKKYKHKSSDTLNDKIGFAKRAVEYMVDYNALSKEAKSLTMKLYDFIGSNNK